MLQTRTHIGGLTRVVRINRPAMKVGADDLLQGYDIFSALYPDQSAFDAYRTHVVSQLRTVWPADSLRLRFDVLENGKERYSICSHAGSVFVHVASDAYRRSGQEGKFFSEFATRYQAYLARLQYQTEVVAAPSSHVRFLR